MKKAVKFLVALVLGTAIFYMIVQRAGLDTLRETVSLFFSIEGLILVGITFLIWMVGILRWKVVLNCQGEDKNFRDLMGVWTVGYTIDYLTPVSLFGGEALRAYLTGNVLNVSWEKSFSSIIIDKILDGTFHLIFLVVGVIVFLRFGGFPEIWIFWAVVLTIFGLAVVLTTFYSRAIGKKSILLLVLSFLGLEKTDVKATKNGEFIFNTEGNVLRFFSPAKSFFWKGVLLSFFRHFLFYIRAIVLIVFIAGSFEPIRSIAIQGMSYLSMLLPLPAGLGGLEAISSFSFETMGLGFERGVVFGMTWRAVDLVVCILGIIFGIKISFKLFQLKAFNFIDKLFKKDKKVENKINNK